MFAQRVASAWWTERAAPHWSPHYHGSASRWPGLNLLKASEALLMGTDTSLAHQSVTQLHHPLPLPQLIKGVYEREKQ